MHGGGYDYGLWTLVAVNVALFAAFALSFLRPKTRHEWRSMGVFGAFVVALFTEMYGLPLTIYVLSSWLGVKIGLGGPFEHLSGHLLGSLLRLPDWTLLAICQVGAIVMFTGVMIMASGWRRVHAARGELVTDGIYAVVRHPQYSGLFLVAVGMLIQWPTIATILMFPVLTVAYLRLAKREERAMENAFGEQYQSYRSRVPAFVPTVESWRYRRRHETEDAPGIDGAERIDVHAHHNV